MFAIYRTIQANICHHLLDILSNIIEYLPEVMPIIYLSGQNCSIFSIFPKNSQKQRTHDKKIITFGKKNCNFIGRKKCSKKNRILNKRKLLWDGE